MQKPTEQLSDQMAGFFTIQPLITVMVSPLAKQILPVLFQLVGVPHNHEATRCTGITRTYCDVPVVQTQRHGTPLFKS